MNLEPFSKILAEYKSISSSEPFEPTFMDLSRYPHYENVCSNILAFYFDRNETHGMDNMLLLALCKSYDDSFKEHHFESVNVQREVFTSEGKKIDIVIEDNNYILAIENKIFQDVYNDLEDYSNYVDTNAKGREKIKILLSLYKSEAHKLSAFGFKNILYAELFGKLEEIIGRYILNANNKYLIYLFDFIKTIQRLEKGTVMNKEFIRFLSDNENEINRLLVETSNVRKELRRKLKELSELINIEKYKNVRLEYYKELFGELYDELFYDIKISDNLTIYIDVILSPSGWYFEINPKKNSQSKFEDFIRNKNIQLIDSYEKGRKRISETYEYDESLEVIARTLQNVIDLIEA